MKKSFNITKYILIAISVIFLSIMLVLPLGVVIYNSLKDGIYVYINSISNKYTLSALGITLLATVISVIVNTIFGVITAITITKFDFKGKKVLSTLIDIPFSISPVIAGLSYIITFGRMGWATPIIDWFNQTFNLDIKIVFAVPGVVLATIFVTFPFVSREIIPVLNVQGRNEEEAGALLGANSFSIFKNITFPHIKWALLYGVVLRTARALGEFGAVSALSKIRGKTFTLPLEITYLYDGADTLTQSFAVSSILLILSIIILILKSIVESKKINV